MLDAGAQAARLPGVAGSLEGVERGAVRGVPDRVHGHRPVSLGRAPHHVLEPLARADLHAGAVEQPRGGGAERAVHEPLEIAHPQHVVAEAGAQAECAQVVEALPGKRLPHAQVELASFEQVLEHLERAEPAVLVVDCHHAARRRNPHSRARGVHHLANRRVDIAVAECPRRVLAQDAASVRPRRRAPRAARRPSRAPRCSPTASGSPSTSGPRARPAPRGRAPRGWEPRPSRPRASRAPAASHPAPPARVPPPPARAPRPGSAPPPGGPGAAPATRWGSARASR